MHVLHQILPFEIRHQSTQIFRWSPNSRNTLQWRRGYPLARSPLAGREKLPSFLRRPRLGPRPPACRAPPPAPPPLRSPRGCGAESGGRWGERHRRGQAVAKFEPCLPVIYFCPVAHCLPLLCSQTDRTDTALAEAWIRLDSLFGRISRQTFLTM